MEFTDLYPARVTPGKDGIYRWSRQVDMNRDHSTRDQFRTAILIVCGSVCALMVIFSVMVGDFSFIWIPFACSAFVMLISFPIFKLFKAGYRDRFSVAYEMNDEALLTIWDPAVQRQTNNTALLTAALSMAAGHPLEGLGYGLSAGASSQPVLTKYQSVRGIRESRAENRLDLQMFTAPRPVWVPKEDYDMVLDYIRAHISDAQQKWNPDY